MSWGVCLTWGALNWGVERREKTACCWISADRGVVLVGRKLGRDAARRADALAKKRKGTQEGTNT